MDKKSQAATSATQDVHPTDQKDSQADKADMKKEGKKAVRPKTRMGHALHIAAKALQIIGALIGFAAAILGIVTGYVALEPRVSVSQNEQLDPNDPFSSPFIVSNDGPLPMENVRFTCGIGSTHYEHGPTVKGAPNYRTNFIFLPDAKGNLPVQNFGAIEMKPGERSTIPSCNYPFPKSVEGADIGIVVNFRIAYIHVNAERVFQKLSHL